MLKKPGRGIVRSILLLLICLPALLSARTAAPLLDTAQLAVLSESAGAPLSLDQVRGRFSAGQGREVSRTELTFGIGNAPTWLRIRIDNPSAELLVQRLTAGATWTDRLDVYHLDAAGHLQQWHTGDAIAGAPGMVPGVGFTFALQLSPGRNDVYLRAQTDDPMVLPLDLMPTGDAAASDGRIGIGYGFLYGFLLALVAYNILFFNGLRRVRYFYYSLYVGSFILTNIAYTGQGLSWLWTDSPAFQRYVILVLMVTYAVSGLAFASHFLQLARCMPRALRFIRAYQLLGPVAMLVAILMGSQLGAAWIAFVYFTGMTLAMLLLGVANARRVEEGGYFLVAAVAGMLGMLSTDLTVWGIIPFSQLSYHGAEIGVVIEAVVFALALAKQLRVREAARRRAEHLASHDPLTGLRNRRAFFEEANREWHRAMRNGHQLSVVMADMDHFKRINDRFGHGAGDQALLQLSGLVRQTMRSSDLVARWGGEEIVLLLPDADQAHAMDMAIRLREIIAATPLNISREEVMVTASFGVATLQGQEDIERLIDDADKALLKAKQGGRNTVRAFAGD